MTARVAVIGAGGHGRVVADIVRAMSDAGADVELAGFLDADARLHGAEVLGAPVLGGDDALAGLVAGGQVSHFVLGVGSVRGGDNLRRKLFAMAQSSGATAFAAAHPRAVLAPDVALGEGAVVMAGAVLNVGVRVGANAIVNTGAVVDHDGRIGDHAHVAPGATLSGSVTVGENALVGVGASCVQGVAVGGDATVGAGATVTADVAPGVTVAGCPARPIG